mmetsp:Transcript_38079/g.93576  ORF Transcript_38079/g.93576 Transcript_38079/m.93576 type:complete len:297 (+) Transcript_38079:179-1069(+)
MKSDRGRPLEDGENEPPRRPLRRRLGTEVPLDGLPQRALLRQEEQAVLLEEAPRGVGRGWRLASGGLAGDGALLLGGEVRREGVDAVREGPLAAHNLRPRQLAETGVLGEEGLGKGVRDVDARAVDGAPQALPALMCLEPRPRERQADTPQKAAALLQHKDGRGGLRRSRRLRLSSRIVAVQRGSRAVGCRRRIARREGVRVLALDARGGAWADEGPILVVELDIDALHLAHAARAARLEAVRDALPRVLRERALRVGEFAPVEVELLALPVPVPLLDEPEVPTAVKFLHDAHLPV